MIVNKKNVAVANEMRRLIQTRTETISDGEGVAMVLLWSFLMDHAKAHNIDVEKLAREQLEDFIMAARGSIALAREH